MSASKRARQKGDPELSKKFAALADIFVNDAFGSAHRAHSSTAGVADYLPSAVGYLIRRKSPSWDELLRLPSVP